MKKEVIPYLVVWFILFMTIQGCQPSVKSGDIATDVDELLNDRCESNISAFKRGDIIVKPNLNFLPGSAAVPNGVYFGHAAIVTKGYQHSNIDSLLANIEIIESMALDVPKEFQVREIAGYVKNSNPIYNCTSFKKQFEGNRYRLRLNISEAQIDSVISFACEQKGDYSTWNAMKSFPDNELDDTKSNWADNAHWYCSLLVWQSVYYVTGIDLDVNKGFQVYPNDLIVSPFFDNTDSFTGRARF